MGNVNVALALPVNVGDRADDEPGAGAPGHFVGVVGEHAVQSAADDAAAEKADTDLPFRHVALLVRSE